MPDEPKFGRLPAAQRRSGLSRGALYNIAAQNPGLFLKAGQATIVDLQKLDTVLANLPPAKIKTGLASQRNSDT